ncbi:hypothetical protein F4806DRAFT_186891 [Annulohypoxylon nitens]|nr:hypothetical protein F4806DRAFT_186891 [Annulohypoxylon nitens]
MMSIIHVTALVGFSSATRNPPTIETITVEFRIPNNGDKRFEGRRHSERSGGGEFKTFQATFTFTGAISARTAPSTYSLPKYEDI